MEVEALVACMEVSGRVLYAITPTIIRSYGGGLQELASKGLDRVMTAHAQVC